MVSNLTDNVSTPRVSSRRSSAPVRRSAPGTSRTALRRQRAKVFTAILAGLGAALIPAATYAVVHYQAPKNPFYWILAVAGLAYSAPTVQVWAKSWAKWTAKAWAFTVISEAMLSFGLPWMSYVALVILVGINVLSAVQAALDSKK